MMSLLVSSVAAAAAGSAADVTMGIKVSPEQAFGNGIQPLRTKLDIRNQGGTPLEGARLWYTGSTYDTDEFVAVAKIKPGARSIVQFDLTSKHHFGPESFDQFPTKISFELTTKDGMRIATAEGNTDVAWFIGALGETFKPQQFLVENFNILLFGTHGAGKSSFFNSVLCMSKDGRSGEACAAPAPVLGQSRHCTVTFNRLEGIGLPITFWDTWGLTLEQYNGNELEMIMQGRLPEEWQKDDDVRLATEDDEADSWERKPHAVIFFLPHSLLGDPDNELVVKVRNEIANIVGFGVNPIVLLSMIDKSEPELRFDPMRKSETVEQFTNLAQQVLGIGKGSIYPMVNYLQDDRKIFNIDLNLYRILHRALSNAKHNLEAMQRKSKRMSKSKSTPLIMKQLLAAEADVQTQRSRAVRCEENLEDKKDELVHTKEREMAAIGRASEHQLDAERKTSELTECKHTVRKSKDELEMRSDELSEAQSKHRQFERRKDELERHKDELERRNGELEMRNGELEMCNGELEKCQGEEREASSKLIETKSDLRHCQDSSLGKNAVPAELSMSDHLRSIRDTTMMAMLIFLLLYLIWNSHEARDLVRDLPEVLLRLKGLARHNPSAEGTR